MSALRESAPGGAGKEPSVHGRTEGKLGSLFPQRADEPRRGSHQAGGGREATQSRGRGGGAYGRRTPRPRRRRSAPSRRGRATANRGAAQEGRSRPARGHQARGDRESTARSGTEGAPRGDVEAARAR